MQLKRQHIAGALITCLCFISIATTAAAVTWNEISDAGDTPLTAQTPIGIGALNTIMGTLSPANDTDVFRIYIPDPSIFAVDMIGTSLSGDNDTELYILNALGNLVFNNDDSGPGWLSEVNAGNLTGQSAGIYLIAYNLFSSVPENSQLNPVTGWTVNPYHSQTGTVQLNLTGAEFVPQLAAAETASVPEPSSLLLFTMGFVGFAARKLRLKFF